MDAILASRFNNSDSDKQKMSKDVLWLELVKKKNQQLKVQALESDCTAPALTSSMTMGKLFNFAVPQSFICKIGLIRALPLRLVVRTTSFLIL